MANVPKAHEDLLIEITGGDKQYSFVLETEGTSGDGEEYPDIEFDVNGADKPTRAKLRRHMPPGIFKNVDLDEIDDLENASAEDIDLSGIDMDPNMLFGEKETRVWLEVVSEHFTHDYYSTSEVKAIFDSLGDEALMKAGTYLIEIGSGTGPITGFRRG